MFFSPRAFRAEVSTHPWPLGGLGWLTKNSEQIPGIWTQTRVPRGVVIPCMGTACGHEFRAQIREFSNFHQLIPTQKGSIGLDSNTFRTSGQSRTAGGQAFASRPSPLARHVLVGQRPESTPIN